MTAASTTAAASSSHGAEADEELADDEISVAIRSAMQPWRVPKDAISIQWIESG